MRSRSTPPSTVIKASGDRVPFSPEKLQRSLERSGASPALAEEIMKSLQSALYNGISTKEIYTQAYARLKHRSRLYAGRYNIKKALMQLGPSGFPFEQYIAEIFKHKGWNAATGQLFMGHCVKHEVDIVAHKDAQHALIECKYHNHRGTTCDVKTSLYIHARFQDIDRGLKERGESTYNEGWLITNTRFTDDGITYATCAGLKLIGWNYPGRGNLQHWIESSGLYPITCLTSLTRTEKQKVLNAGIVLCGDLANSERTLEMGGLAPGRITTVLEECRTLSREF